MNIESEIENQEFNLSKATSSYAKLNICNCIIQFKIISTNEHLKKTLYSDIKNYINYSVQAIEEQGSSYYELNSEDITRTISFLSIKEQISILQYLERELKKNGHDYKINWIRRLLKKKKILDIKSNFSFTKLPVFINCIATYNVWTIFATLTVIFSFYSVILLPAGSENYIFYNSKFVFYSSNSILNHILNTLLSFCGIESDFQINPLNIGGVIILILIKIIFIVFIISYLFEELKSKLKI